MLTLLPRRRGQYRLRLNLHAATVPQLPRGSHGGCCSGTAGGRALSASSACSSPGAATPPSAGRLCAPSATGAESPMRLGGSLSAANSPSPRGAGMLAPRHAKSASCSLARSSLGAVRLDDGRRSGSSSIDSGTAEALEVIRAARNASSLCPGSAAAAAAGAAGRDEPRAVAGDGSSGGGGCDGAGGGCAAGLLARAPLATAAVTADASFPSLLFTDVFCEGLPKQVSWQMLGLSQLNVELRCPVTAAEVQAQQLADKGQLLQEGAAALLPPFLVDLGMAQAAGRPRQIWVELSNDGVLPVEWELHSYDAPQVTLYKARLDVCGCALSTATDKRYAGGAMLMMCLCIPHTLSLVRTQTCPQPDRSTSRTGWRPRGPSRRLRRSAPSSLTTRCLRCCHGTAACQPERRSRCGGRV